MIKTKIAPYAAFARKLVKDRSGLAIVEFAVGLPFFMGLAVAGIETANYAAVVMQLNQLTIHTADSGARMGEGGQLSEKRISETLINDVFAGTIREGDSLLIDGQHAFTDVATGSVSLRGNAKMWMSSVEPVSPFVAGTPRYRMRWQRCMGTATFFTPTYGTPATATNVVGVGPTGRQIVAPPNGAAMFVELKYWFKPVVIGRMTKLVEREIAMYAAMVVRDNRDYTQIYNAEAATPSSC
jgi:hypothetical protein